VGRYLQTYSKADFAPRFGFAYDLFGKGKTILRGGIGKYWNNPLTGTSSSKAQNPPFLLDQTYPTTFSPSTQSCSNPGALGCRLSNGLPNLPIVDPNRPASGTTRSIFDPNFRDGYAWQWNLDVQQQLGKDYLFSVGYVGSQCRQLVVRRNLDQARATLGGDSVKNRPYYSLAPGITMLAQSFNGGTLDYHGLLVRFDRRFANNFSFSNSYTFGKGIDLGDSSTDGNSSFLDSYDFSHNRGRTGFDIVHTLISTVVYELPIARRTALGGWRVSGLMLLRSGYPLTVNQTQNVTSVNEPTTGNRPNRIAKGTVSNPTIDQWFDNRICPAGQISPDNCSFAAPTETTATFGNSGKSILDGPGQFTVDLALIKATKIKGLDTELRLEAFNAFNHPVFGNPNTQLGNANFGKITALLPGTPMRQVQLGMKVRF
jgi:hypothetical protein